MSPPICTKAFALRFGEEHGLSYRQRQVFSLFLQGCSSQEMGKIMDIGASTVKFHRGCLFKKTRCKTLSGLFAMALASLSLTAPAIEHLSKGIKTKTRKTVLGLMVRGYSHKDIARLRKTKLSTTQTHVSHVFRSLGIGFREELFRKFFLECEIFLVPLRLKVKNPL